MDIKTAVHHVHSKFNYLADKKLYIGDGWFVMPERNQKMFGDCDDFAITSLWLACDENIFKFILNVFILHRYRLYHSKTVDGEAHIIGYAQGLWFDNFTGEALPEKQFFEKTKHKKWFFYPSPYILWFMLLGLFVRNMEVRP